MSTKCHRRRFSPTYLKQMFKNLFHRDRWDHDQVRECIEHFEKSGELFEVSQSETRDKSGILSQLVFSLSPKWQGSARQRICFGDIDWFLQILAFSIQNSLRLGESLDWCSYTGVGSPLPEKLRVKQLYATPKRGYEWRTVAYQKSPLPPEISSFKYSGQTNLTVGWRWLIWRRQWNLSFSLLVKVYKNLQSSNIQRAAQNNFKRKTPGSQTATITLYVHHIRFQC